MSNSIGDILGTIKIVLIEEAKLLTNINQKYESDISLVSGWHCVDAKSLMGIFSLSFSNPVDLVFVEKAAGEKEKYIEELKSHNFNFVTK